MDTLRSVVHAKYNRAEMLISNTGRAMHLKPRGGLAMWPYTSEARTSRLPSEMATTGPHLMTYPKLLMNFPSNKLLLCLTALEKDFNYLNRFLIQTKRPSDGIQAWDRHTPPICENVVRTPWLYSDLSGSQPGFRQHVYHHLRLF